MEFFKQIVLNQFEASLRMFHDALALCPAKHWDGLVAKYPFWQVAYHTLCFADLYLSRTEEAFELRAIHPRGMCELDDENPSRRFERAELLDYVLFCRDKLRREIAADTAENLQAPSGHSGRRITRGELHIYNIRHLQHHTGQLTAYLRRVEPTMQEPKALRWISGGWPE